MQSFRGRLGDNRVDKNVLVRELISRPPSRQPDGEDTLPTI